MAIVTSKPSGNNLVSQPRTGANAQGKLFDINDANAPTGKAHKLDTTEDAWKRTAPPDMGRYSLKLDLGDAPNPKPLNDRNGQFDCYAVSIIGRVVESKNGSDGAIVFGTVTTRINRGKNISTAAALLVKLGYKIPDREVTEKEVATWLHGAIAKHHPVIENNLCDWQGSYQEVLPNGKERYVNLFTTQEEFPLNDDGTYQHETSTSDRNGGRVDITARFVVKEWGGKGSFKEETDTPVLQQDEPAPEPIPITPAREVAATASATSPQPIKATAAATKTPAKAKKAPEPEPEPEELDTTGDDELVLA